MTGSKLRGQPGQHKEKRGRKTIKKKSLQETQDQHVGMKRVG